MSPKPGVMTALLQKLAAAPAGPGEAAAAPPLEAGAVVGRFELVRELGRGGFGVVWEATDRELKRKVAFKLLLSDPAAAGAEQLQREAEVVARLSHPNLVTLFDVGRCEQGAYLVLELLRGETLQRRLDRGPVPLREALALAVDVARGLAYAHGEGVVHRDLKPSNVFLCERGGAKLLDFGMAHAFGRRRLSGGTPAYMAPEQWAEDPEDERTDVFALGVLLHRMLSGEYPYPEDGGRWSSGPARAPGLEVPEARGLGSLVGRMLEKAPRQRPRDGAEVLSALEELQAALLHAGPAHPGRTTRRRTGLRDLVAEFKRRRVFRVIVGYGIFAFAVLQVVEPVMHGAHLSDWVLTATLVALALGFPVAVVLSWLFDLTAAGVRRTPSATGPRAVTLSRGRLAALLVGVGLLAAAPGVGWFAWKHGAPATAGGAPAAAAASVAVLPFADLSPGHDQEYFADGMAEEILDKLAQVKQLKVIGRTSSFSFKGRTEDLRVMGQKLGAGHLLEGSVRKAGSRVRITAQLIETAGGSHVWSETFDRELTDVFALQDEIARAVAAALRASLVPGTPARAANPEAYNQYLLGLQFGRLGTEDGTRRALEAYRKAMQLDPGFAQAQARLAGATQAQYQILEPDSLGSLLELQRRALAEAEKAVALGPALPDGYRVRATIRTFAFYDWEGAKADLEKARALGPEDAALLSLEATVLETDGHLLQAIGRLERAAELDPLATGTWQQLGRSRLMAGQLEPARLAFRRSLEISPDSVWSSFWASATELLAGSAEVALASFQRHPQKDMQLIGAALCLDRLGRRAEADRALAELVRDWAHLDAYQVAEIHAARGDRDAAFAWLDRSWRQHDGGITWVKIDPFLAPIRRDPRYAGLLRSLRLPPDEGATAAPAPSPAASSIAVLPFADMSERHDQEYFADGVAEEILNALAHVEGLKVIARTSSFSFKGKNEDLRRIGQALDVANVLEGSLRKDGDQVRVTAQLIRVADGSHVWSETFDRKLTGIFKVQDEIARAVVRALRGALLPDRPSPGERPSTTPAAYEQYLAGLHGSGENPDGYARSIAAFERAVALDPGYAPAWAALAMTSFWNVTVYGGDTKVAVARASVAAARAIQLAPDLAEGFVARGLLRSSVDWDWKGGQADFERALAIEPGHALAKRRYGVLLCNLGKQEEGLRWLEASVALDPLSAGSWNAVGSTRIDLGQMDQARRALRRGLSISPDNVLLLQNLGDIDLLEGRPEAALAIYRTMNSELFRLGSEAMALHSLGRDREARETIATLEARYGATSPENVAEVYGWMGDPDAAFRWIERAVTRHDPGLRELENNRYLRSLRGDPRYAAALRRMNLPVR